MVSVNKRKAGGKQEKMIAKQKMVTNQKEMVANQKERVASQQEMVTISQDAFVFVERKDYVNKTMQMIDKAPDKDENAKADAVERSSSHAESETACMMAVAKVVICNIQCPN